MVTNISDGCPYKGLQPYTEADREYFFGREKDREIIASNLYVAPLTILYGTSGVGKSSVLQAGAIPQLRESSRVIVVLFNRWQSESFDYELKENVLRAVCESVGKDNATVLSEVSQVLEAKETMTLQQLTLDELLTGCTRAFRRRILLIFDQFEEYFLYHSTTTGTQGFDAEFARAVNQQESGINFMLAMREEELSKLDRFRPRVPNLLANLLRLQNLDPESAGKAIREPLRVYNEKHPDAMMAIEDDLVAAIIEQVRPGHFTSDVAKQSSPSGETSRTELEARIETPFLQLVLIRLWEAEKASNSNTLRLSTFQTLGGALQIARTHLDKVMGRLSDSERATAAAVLRFLVTPTGSKIAQQPAALAAWAELSQPDVESVLRLLSSGQEMNILRKVNVPGQAPRYELFHDVLGPGILDWRARYVQAQRLVQERAKVEQAYSEERQRRMRQAMAVLCLLLLLMGGLTVYAFRQSRKATEQSAEARKQSAEARKQAEIARIALSEATRAQKELEDEKKKVETERDRAKEEEKKAGLSAERAKASEKKAIAAQQIAETQRKRANEQEQLAKAAAEIRALGLKGFDATRIGDLDEAIKQFSQARELYRKAGDDPGEAYALVNIAESHANKPGGPSSALLKIFDSESLDDDSQASAETYTAMYSVLLMETDEKTRKQTQKNQDLAIASFNDAITVINQNKEPDLKNRASIYHRMGDLHYLAQLTKMMRDIAVADIDKPTELYGNAVKDYTKIGLHKDAGTLLMRLGFLLESVSKEEAEGSKGNQDAEIARAHKFYEDAQQAFRRAGDKQKEAQLLTRLGESFGNLSDEPSIRKAIEYYKQATQIYRDLNDGKKEGNSYEEIGKLYAKLPNKSHAKEALENYEIARKVFQRERVAVERRPESDFGEDEAVKPPDLTEEKQMLEAIRNLYKGDERRHQILDNYFASVIESYTDSSPIGRARRAEMLEKIADLFVRDVAEFGKTSEDARDKKLAIKYYEPAATAWNEADNHANAADTLMKIGELYAELQDKQKTIVFFEKVRAIYRNNAQKSALRDRMTENLIKIAKAYTAMGEQRSAIDVYDQAFSLYDQGSTSEFSFRVVEIVKLATELSDEQEASKLFQRALDYTRKMKNVSGEASILATAGDYYVERGNTDKALDYYKRSFSTSPPSAGFEILKAIGRLYLDQGDVNGATKYFQEVRDVYRKANNLSAEADALVNIADSFSESDRKREAIDYYTQALPLKCKAGGSYGVTSSLKALSTLFRQSGDRQEANRLSKLANNASTLKDCDVKIKTLSH